MQRIILKFLTLLLLSAAGFAWLSQAGKSKPITAYHHPGITIEPKISPTEFSKLQSKGSMAKAFVKDNHFDTSICFLADMSLACNSKRFFIYDLRKDTLQNSGLVAHGNCNQYWLEGRKYGNEIGCGCTSLGKYRIGNSYYGRFGLAFKLYGLEKTNNNAFKRYVVLHGHNCIPETETAEEVCQSNGCPMVAPGFLKQLEAKIKKARKPVLLWIFE